MNSKLLAVALAVLTVTAGGAAAVSGTVQQSGPDAAAHDVNVETTYTNGTVTVTVTNAGEPVENATVEVGDEEYTTDANGTVSADVEAEEELGVEIEGDDFEAELEYRLADGELTPLEESYEYGDGEAESDDDEADDEPEEEADEEADAEPEEDEQEDGDDDDETEDEEELDEEADDDDKENED